MNYCDDELKKQQFIIKRDRKHDIAIYDSNLLIIEEALRSLSSEQQQLLHMKYFMDIKNKELAAIHNVPEGTIKSRVHNVLSKLRTFLSEKGDEK